MRSYTINIIPEYTADPVVHISQYDKHYPIYFTIMDGDAEADLTGATALFSMTKPDGTKAYEECAISDNKVLLFVTPQMSAAAGNGTAKITLTKNTRKESTSAFSFIIDAAAAPEDYLSEYEMLYYESMLSRLDDALIAAGSVAGYAESAEASASAAAASASQARAIAMADVIACYPVGSVLITTTNTNPGTIIGGTWTEIKGKFLLAQSNSHPAGTTGGSETVTLTVNQIPNHVHNLSNLLKNSGGTDNIGWTGYAFKNSSVHPLEDIINTKGAGGGQAHNNMPPYVAVYVWERTA
jgi:hypothetical protein